VEAETPKHRSGEQPSGLALGEPDQVGRNEPANESFCD
jgi:hypothetical protein